MPEEHIFVVVTVSGDFGSIKYDHGITVANWADDGDGWIYDDPILNRFKDDVIIHAWCDLAPYGG